MTAPRLHVDDFAVGTRFGRLVITGSLKRDQEILMTVLCDCGKTGTAHKYRLRNGETRSCGCLTRDVSAMRMTKHGHNKTGKRSRTYECWSSMIQRCTNPKKKHYHRYGGRGIAVCERWRAFDDFLADMGEAPPGHSIDRIDNDRGYELGNCRWATPTTQGRNMRSVRLSVEAAMQIRWLCNDAGYRACDVADAFGVSRSTIRFVLIGTTWKDAA